MHHRLLCAQEIESRVTNARKELALKRPEAYRELVDAERRFKEHACLSRWEATADDELSGLATYAKIELECFIDNGTPIKP